MKTIALFTNLPEFDLGPLTWSDLKITNQYPGSRWVHYLHQEAKAIGAEVCPGGQVVRRITRGELDPKKVYIVCEEVNPLANYLIEMQGCHPSLIFCLESPLYVPYFYKSLEAIKPKFKAHILFGALGTHHAYFPSYDLKDPIQPFPWELRNKGTCMVMSNKRGPSLESYDENQLITSRYFFINTFKRMNHFDLYGKGWPESEAKLIPPGDKIKTLEQYRVNICFENYALPGMITEKLIECFQAGCLPIYLGAPDVEKYIPKECFYDPKAGVDFLKGKESYKYSYQYFANQVLEILLDQGL